MSTSAVPTALLPYTDGRPPHLPCRPGDINPDVLLPGDPDRVELLGDMLDDAVKFGRRREFAVVSGRYNGYPLTICSSGIGGPSTEIALVELAILGARRVIRIGGTSALASDIQTGSFLVADKAIGTTGVANLYADDRVSEFDSDPELCTALSNAGRSLGFAVCIGTVATTDSYYLGQDRPTEIDQVSSRLSRGRYLHAFRARGALGVDMESQVVLAVSRHLGLQSASLLGVHGNRLTDEWLVDYEPTQRNLLHIAGSALIWLRSQDREEKEE